MTAKPLCIDLYCGLGGWAEGFLSEGWDVVGFDIERHQYGDAKYPAQLVIQDVLTLHGAQLRRAHCLVASPPCQEPSYRAMPWSRAKALNAAGPPEKFIRLFNACFRLQHEAIAAAGRHIPLVVENVNGAQPWVGSAKWHYGNYYLWGDVPALMPRTSVRPKIPGQMQADGIKTQGKWFGPLAGRAPDALSRLSSGSVARKAASAAIAKIPFELARHIARTYYPSH